MGKFHSSYELGALAFLMSVAGWRLALVPLFACMVGCIIRSVRAYHLICQHDKLPSSSSLLMLLFLTDTVDVNILGNVKIFQIIRSHFVFLYEYLFLS